MTTKEQISKVKSYYKKNNILDYKKTKMGEPDMRNQENKTVLKNILKQEILDKNKSENSHNFTIEKEGNYRSEIESLTDEEINQFRKMSKSECVICGESMKDNCCILKCKHSFCVSCFAEHSRNSNSCPLCREEYCSKSKKIEKMPRQVLHSIFEMEYHQLKNYGILNEPSETYLFKDCIKNEIGDFEAFLEKFKHGDIKQFNEQIYNDYKAEMVSNIFKNIHELNISLCKKVLKFYEDQLCDYRWEKWFNLDRDQMVKIFQEEWKLITS